MSRRKWATLFVLLLSMRYIVRAECPLAEFVLSGVAIDQQGRPVANAEVDIHLDDEDPATVKTDADGRFLATLSFGTDSGFCFGYQQCNRAPKTVRVVIASASGGRGVLEVPFVTRAPREGSKPIYQLPTITVNVE